MILADANIWIDFFRSGEPGLRALLAKNQVIMHPHLVAELALGSLHNRLVTLSKLDDLLESYERRVITETLKRHDCNVAKASEALGLGSRQTLYKKLKRLAIDIGDFLQEDTEPGMQYRA